MRRDDPVEKPQDRLLCMIICVKTRTCIAASALVVMERVLVFVAATDGRGRVSSFCSV